MDAASSSLKVLQVYNRIPYPLRDGGVKAVHHMATCLEQLGHKVRWFCMNPTRNRVEASELPSDLAQGRRMQTVDLRSDISVFGALLSLFQRKPYHLSRFEQDQVSRKLRQTLDEERPDLVLVEGLAAALYLPLLRQYPVRVFYRAHNVESEILRQKARSYPRWHPLFWWLGLEYRKVLAFEKKVLNESDAVLAISSEDAVTLSKMQSSPKPVMTLGYWPPHPSAQKDLAAFHNNPQGLRGLNHPGLRLGFIGTLDWLPNLDAVQWFLEDWLPQFRSIHPSPTFHLAGRKIPSGLGADLPGVVVHGEVEDASAFMAQCDLLVMPLRMGSGLKIKALEAIWLGIPLLSTALGVQGLGLRPRLDYWPAENPAEFLEGLQRLHAEPELLDQMRQNALQTLKEHLQPDLQLKNLSALLQPLTSA